MRKRPFIFSLLAFVYLTIAISFPIQVAVLYEHDWNELDMIWDKLSALNILVIGGCFLCARALWKGLTWARWALPSTLALIGVNNVIVGVIGTDFSLEQTLAGWTLLLAAHAPLVRQDLIALLKEPRRQWWRQAERRRIAIPVSLRGHALETHSFDLSETGVFIPVNLSPSLAMKSWPVAKELPLSLSLDKGREIQCHGRVVRRAPAKGSYPAGVGLEFTGMSRSDRRDFRRFLAAQAEL